MRGQRSNVRVEVAFEDAVVFAGESLSAVITFRNVAGGLSHSVGGPNHHHHHRHHHHRKHSLISLDEVSAPEESGYRQSEDGSPGLLSVNNSPAATNGLNRSMSMNRGSSRFGPGRREGHATSNSTSETYNSRNSMSLSRPDPNSEGMIMGFVQLQGYFELEDSIVDAEAFDHVKRHGVVLGQRGLDYGSGMRNGFFKGLTSGLGNFLGNNSSSGSFAAEHQNTEAIPIFSTPQSLLFVDLKLAPGECRSFGYHIKLPKGLPPSCRGKAVRIHYNLAIGTQKLDVRGRPEPKIVLAPFRLFPHVDNIGTEPVHNLEEPIVQKADEAQITPLSDRKHSMKSLFAHTKSSQQESKKPISHSSNEDLRAYIDSLLSTSSHQAYSGSLTGRRTSSIPTTSSDDRANFSCRDNIEFFVRYQHLDAEKPFKSNFEIGRGGHRIASASLCKPVFRVGEDIVLLLDFSDAVLSCYHVTASLETTEQVSPDVAKRSEQETQMATRRIFSQLAQATFSNSKTHFDFTIPSTATPEFTTSDISLSWSIKLDFITSPQQQVSKSILKSIHADDNGDLKTPLRVLECETFSARIPLHVYPTNHDIGALLDPAHLVRKWPL
ncbi:hypothetical protein TRICI_001815 [Trichomonascus ciferrii]|uniref:Rgp1-domain-containing protein n=1 Tax=Trichomonascus ciferrii TaxID=44093 RepID=A0A642V7D3_9ASCO|nr:hypothetical protein TRICI_001815 [Trichomonascus ciferrii]